MMAKPDTNTEDGRTNELASESTDDLFDMYAVRRQIHANRRNAWDADHTAKAGRQAHEIEDELEARGVPAEKVREWWDEYRSGI